MCFTYKREHLGSHDSIFGYLKSDPVVKVIDWDCVASEDKYHWVASAGRPVVLAPERRNIVIIDSFPAVKLTTLWNSQMFVSEDIQTRTG